ncbi:hypothetical protein BCR44DRAFT_1323277 [Catenaria anguillulae PL171]|uniref:XPG-I domain-containing protein n=1 Tax=Catenaria anguillulae PL171 TaxID=765915 RepID=A0A1Y2HUS9_9FUNG|nr:hypothetical protein BCR44DRAFT_1323277 [Catenaria anguillulae PL171]
MLDNVKLPRTNIHKLLATTLAATTQPTFNPLISLSTARSQARLESLRLERTSAGLPSHVLYDVLLLLRARAVPTLLTPDFTEAEQLCGALAHLRIVDYAVSDDSDTGVFYPDVHVIRSFFQYNKRPVVLGPMSELALALRLVPEGSDDTEVKKALVDFSILAGCDYSGKIPGVGPMTAIKLIMQFGSIERILDAKPEMRVKVQGDDTWDPDAARAVFNNEHLDTDELLDLVNEAAELADLPLTAVDHRVPDALSNSSFWSLQAAAGRAPSEVEVLDAMGIRAFDPEVYVQNLMALEPQV